MVSRRPCRMFPELACSPLWAGVPTAELRARRSGPRHHFASIIDYRHNIVEHMAYTEEKGNYSSQKFPRKPEFPR
jgi:hypothetical protein